MHKLGLSLRFKKNGYIRGSRPGGRLPM